MKYKKLWLITTEDNKKFKVMANSLMHAANLLRIKMPWIKEYKIIDLKKTNYKEL